MKTPSTDTETQGPHGSVQRGRILIVDDEPEMCSLLEARLGKLGFEIHTETSAEAALVALEHGEFDVVLTDLNLRGPSGTELCERVVGGFPNVPVVVLTAFGSFDTAVAAIRAGAWDFITKPVEIEILTIALERAILQRRMRDEVQRLRSALHEPVVFSELLGESTAMRRVADTAMRIAETDSSVLLQGESGTGKEVVARAIHRASRRAGGPFVALNCAALPETLLESELFGHERGAFTDARSARTGLLVRATSGTLFLDEIGDMPLALQPKLLRVLEERKVRPLGGERETPIDVRIIAATHHDLERAIVERTFRDDLYYRIAVITLALPPLRARGTDVLLLAQSFIRRYAEQMHRDVQGLSAGAAERLMSYDFPGNVRELSNMMERGVALARHSELTLEDLPEKLQQRPHGLPSASAQNPSEQLVPLEQVERHHILKVLEAVGGNKTLAAQVLGLDRKTLYRKLEAWNRAAS